MVLCDMTKGTKTGRRYVRAIFYCTTLWLSFSYFWMSDAKLILHDTQAPQQAGLFSHRFKRTVTTVFWIGEDATRESGYIPNHGSFWDEKWVEHFGGVDDPHLRRGFYPAGFRPKENPFYVALPFAETDENETLKDIAAWIPRASNGDLTKDRWVEVRFRNVSCFGQWEDVGPNGSDDFDWVFGSALRPKNQFGKKAGLDVSPALATCLHLNGDEMTEWRLVDEEDVPDGPWRRIITQR